MSPAPSAAPCSRGPSGLKCSYSRVVVLLVSVHALVWWLELSTVDQPLEVGKELRTNKLSFLKAVLAEAYSWEPSPRKFRRLSYQGWELHWSM